MARRFLPTVSPHVALGAVVLLAAGCGLPTIPFLPAPINPRIEGATPEVAVLSFQHNPDADSDDLRGYVLYYKLYRVGSSLVDDDEEFIGRTPTEPGSRRLEQRGFRRPVLTTIRSISAGSYTEVRETQSSDAPIPLEPTGNAIEFTLDLRLPGGINRDIQPYYDQNLDDNRFDQAEIVVTWQQGGSTFQHGFRRRNVTIAEPLVNDPLETYDGFWDAPAYEAGDADITVMIPDYADEPTTEFEIVLYAIAQGADAQNNFNTYYSEPLRLESAVIQAGQ